MKEFTKHVVIPGQKICTRACLPLLQNEIDEGKMKETFDPPQENVDQLVDIEQENDQTFDSPENEGRTPVDKFVNSLDLSPIRPTIQSEDYLNRKLEEVDSAIRKRLDPDEKFQKRNDFLEFLRNLKEGHHEMDKEEKARLINMLPKSWSAKEISEETGISERFINDARMGRLKFERKEQKNKMSQELKEKIIQFYLSDRISKILPGTTISVKGEDGKRTLMCKQLLLLSVYETYEKYKEKYPEDKVSLSAFRQLRPKHVVLVGSPGTHETCKDSNHKICF